MRGGPCINFFKFVGFDNGTADPWLAVNSDFKEVNVALQLAKSDSHLDIYKKLVELRKDASVKFGETNIKALTNSTLAFTR